MDKHVLNDLVNEGLSAREIGERIGITQTPVLYWLKKHNLKTKWRGPQRGKTRSKRYKLISDKKIAAMQKHYDEGGTFRSLMKMAQISNAPLRRLIAEGRLKIRSPTEAAQLAIKLGRKRYVCTEITREKQRQSALRRIERDPSSHPNRRVAGNRKHMSFPERRVYDELTALQIPFQHNAPVGRYYVDFLFPDFAVEIDGKRWHDAERDAKRDAEIKTNHGITIIRFNSQIAVKKTQVVIDAIKQRLSTGCGAK